MVQLIDGIDGLLGKYDLAIIDQWGVLHNGVVPFRGAVAAITALGRSGTNIIILSNSGKLASHSEKLITRMGFDMRYINKVISSGQAARQWLEEKKSPLAARLGKKLIFWGFDEDYSAIKGLGFDITGDINQADFILAAGAGRGALEHYQIELDIGLARGIPLLCTNPDMVANMPDGSLKICPGALAEYYEQKGGQVVRFGKPAREVYDMCLAEYPKAKRIIGIGDSLAHDIKGANNIDADSIFILDGIHEKEFRHGVDKEKLMHLCDAHGVRPTFALAQLRLGQSR
ncbi:MAG: TIGR01459 family HAD-type hydrolase [Alphaproteobacteria bacterium]|nr:TIGR01459 family HAD-type hydrolase [Alphaproteobacteria bacterium]